jgi:general secretion pathway protein C
MWARLVSLVVWAGVAGSAVYWGLKVFVHAPPVPSAAQQVAVQALVSSDWSRLFGADAPPPAADAEPQPPPDTRFQLLGVVAPRASGRGGVALIGVDGKPPRAYGIGAAVEGNLVLQRVQAREAQLGPSGGPVQVRLQLPPVPVASAGPAPAGVTLPNIPAPSPRPFGVAPPGAPGSPFVIPQPTPMPAPPVTSQVPPQASPAQADNPFPGASAAGRRRLPSGVLMRSPESL